MYRGFPELPRSEARKVVDFILENGLPYDVYGPVIGKYVKDMAGAVKERGYFPDSEEIFPDLIILTRERRIFGLLGSVGNILQGTACAAESAFSLFSPEGPAAAYDECQAAAEASKQLILGIAITIAVIVAMIIGLVIYCKCKKGRSETKLMNTLLGVAASRMNA